MIEYEQWSKIESCVSICSTTGDDVCRGCKRFFEVINWNVKEERESIWKRLKNLSQIMASRLKVFDSTMFEESIKHFQLKIKDDLNDLSKA